ncbi:MAG: hypothetical protein JWM16_2280 [Verrucomicrobiales bacterium]|nr:hypothetical protein [Verrucomicrobiales bacterium]
MNDEIRMPNDDLTGRDVSHKVTKRKKGDSRADIWEGECESWQWHSAEDRRKSAAGLKAEVRNPKSCPVFGAGGN